MSRIYIDVDHIVNEYMMSLDDNDYGADVKRSRVRNLAYGAIRDLQFDTLKNITAIALTIDENTQRATLPEDFVDWVAVGILNNAGDFLPLSQNGKMKYLTQEILTDNLGENLLDSDGIPLTSYKTFTPTEPINIISNTNWQQYLSNKGAKFGIGGGVSGNGQFAFDKVNGLLHVDTSVNTNEVIVYYVADESMRKRPRILTYAIDAVKAFIFKNILAYKASVPISEKMLADKRYAIEKAKVRARVNKLTKQDIMFQEGRRVQAAPKGTGRIFG